MKTIILSLTILFLSLINIFAQHERLERLLGEERKENDFSNPALIDSTQLDSIITEYIASENIPGATGLIFKSDGEIIWSGKYGYRNLEFQLPVEDSTLFLMGSISKTFVATAIMQLWQNGLINLDRNINDYLPAGFTVVNPYHPNDTITVKMLMLHTSSLRDNWNFLWPLWGCGDYPVSVDSFLINYFTPGGSYYSSANFYNYSPGSTWNYSNSAVCLLALIIENLTGKNFNEYTRDSILTPLSMNSSSWFLRGMDANKIATPYRYNPPQAMCHIGMAYWPIGQLRTSTVELYNFALAYLNDGIWNNQRILDSTTIAYILSYHGVSTPWGTQGLIWGKDSDVYNNIWGHSGAFVGTQTGMYICIEENWGILFFINLGTNPNYSPGFFPVLAQMANYAAYISATTTFQLSVNVTNGWNMVSIPGLNSPDQNVNTWWAFRDMSANIFKYAGGYQSVVTATPGEGYWMKHTGVRTYNTGDEWPAGGIQIVAHAPLAGATGWNLIGGYEIAATAANVTTIPAGQQSGPIYKYSDGYQVATTLDPGYGYWIKLLSAAQIIIPETLAKDGQPVEYFPENWGKIVLTDATGINYTLYAVKGEVDLSQYELPPSPPAGMFDIRFSSGRIAENLSSSKSIEMNGVEYPVRIKVENMIIRLEDEMGKKLNAELEQGEELKIDNNTINKLIVHSNEMDVPSKYALENNFPNPFNPSTKIKYSVPQSSNVILTVFDILGNEIETLVNEEKTLGTYEVTWYAGQLPSGVYFYQLKAGEFVQTRKMILMR